MPRRQLCPTQWFILDREPSEETWALLRRLSRQCGLLVLGDLDPGDRRKLWRIATSRDFKLIVEGSGAAARVHDQRQLTRGLLRSPYLILISPIHRTPSHPDWRPLPRMRAAALARLAHRKAIALGGMNRKRYAKIARLGFVGWAGISAFKT